MTNTLTITGNLGRDSELRTTQGGKQVLNFSLANTTGWGDNEKTNWFRCALFGDRAAKLADHFTKGTKLLIIGELTFREWTNQDGVKQTSAEVFVKEFEFLSSPSKNDADSRPSRNDADQYPQDQDSLDSDIPF